MRSARPAAAAAPARPPGEAPPPPPPPPAASFCASGATCRTASARGRTRRILRTRRRWSAGFGGGGPLGSWIWSRSGAGGWAGRAAAAGGGAAAGAWAAGGAGAGPAAAAGAAAEPAAGAGRGPASRQHPGGGHPAAAAVCGHPILPARAAAPLPGGCRGGSHGWGRRSMSGWKDGKAVRAACWRCTPSLCWRCPPPRLPCRARAALRQPGQASNWRSFVLEGCCWPCSPPPLTLALPCPAPPCAAGGPELAAAGPPGGAQPDPGGRNGAGQDCAGGREAGRV